MKKLDNKGVSIVELIVSIALISMVMVFMYRLIADVSFDKDSEFYASANQEQRVEIISAIETYILENEITKCGTYTGDTGKKQIYLKSKDGTEKYLYSYKSDDNYIINFNKEKKWKLKKGYSTGDATCTIKNSICECTIPIYTKNENNVKDNNNKIDDITFTFIKSE